MKEVNNQQPWCVKKGQGVEAKWEAIASAVMEACKATTGKAPQATLSWRNCKVSAIYIPVLKSIYLMRDQKHCMHMVKEFAASDRANFQQSGSEEEWGERQVLLTTIQTEYDAMDKKTADQTAEQVKAAQKKENDGLAIRAMAVASLKHKKAAAAMAVAESTDTEEGTAAPPVSTPEKRGSSTDASPINKHARLSVKAAIDRLTSSSSDSAATDVLMMDEFTRSNEKIEREKNEVELKRIALEHEKLKIEQERWKEKQKRKEEKQKRKDEKRKFEQEQQQMQMRLMEALAASIARNNN